MQKDAFDLLKTGQIIYVEGADGQSYPFGINNVLNRELVACQALGRKSTPLVINALNMVTIILPTENGAYLIKSAVDEVDETKSRVTLRPVGDIRQVQRRQYFRLNKPTAQVHYQIIERGVTENDELPVVGMLWDISGSGLGMVVRSPKTIYTNSEIKLKIQITGEGPIELVGEVVRVVPRSIIKSEYLLGVVFSKIREKDRDKIIRHITQEQLSLRKPRRNSSLVR